MRLLTHRRDGTTHAAVVVDDAAVDLDGPDVGWYLRAAEAGPPPVPPSGARSRPVDELDLLPPVLAPSKIVCVGLNYRNHIAEMGHAPPEHPTLFAKYTDALLGPADDLELPPEVGLLDWEVELVVVVGRTVRRATVDEAGEAIAGFCVGNDVSARDWQGRTIQFLQGKTWERSTPVGPWVVTTDELGPRPDLEVSCTVDDEVVQRSRTAELLFDPPTLVSYVSTITTLRPGDLLFTGTPGGVGAARTPPRGLEAGEELVTTIERIGSLRNRCVAPAG